MLLNLIVWQTEGLYLGLGRDGEELGLEERWSKEEIQHHHIWCPWFSIPPPEFSLIFMVYSQSQPLYPNYTGPWTCLYFSSTTLLLPVVLLGTYFSCFSNKTICTLQNPVWMPPLPGSLPHSLVIISHFLPCTSTKYFCWLVVTFSFLLYLYLCTYLVLGWEGILLEAKPLISLFSKQARGRIWETWNKTLFSLF